MNRKQQSVLLAGLLSLVLAGCSSTKGSSDETGSAAASSMGSGAPGGGLSSGSTGGSASTSGTEAGSTAGAATPQGAPGSSTMPGGAPNSVVMTIEVVPKAGAAGAAGAAAVGGSGTAGATGSSMGDEKMYRITLHMDDGSTRVVTQDKAPSFRSGDRVNMTDGMIAQ